MSLGGIKLTSIAFSEQELWYLRHGEANLVVPGGGGGGGAYGSFACVAMASGGWRVQIFTVGISPSSTKPKRNWEEQPKTHETCRQLRPPAEEAAACVSMCMCEWRAGGLLAKTGYSKITITQTSQKMSILIRQEPRTERNPRLRHFL